METKTEIIQYINKTYGARLSSANTSFSNINVAKSVWWTNVPLHKFNGTLHLLFKDTREIIWIVLPVGFVNDLPEKFRIRKDRNSVDIEVLAEKDERYMVDVKSGGTRFNFKPYIREIIAR
ncbi:MAG TPA: hypothetical protein DF409_10950 [Bacteroidales bacterium]|nr:hypothetical protein [Bacteroidales bacterium]